MPNWNKRSGLQKRQSPADAMPLSGRFISDRLRNNYLDRIYKWSLSLFPFFYYFDGSGGGQELGNLPIARLLEEGQALEHRLHHCCTDLILIRTRCTIRIAQIATELRGTHLHEQLAGLGIWRLPLKLASRFFEVNGPSCVQQLTNNCGCSETVIGPLSTNIKRYQLHLHLIGTYIGDDNDTPSKTRMWGRPFYQISSRRKNDLPMFHW